MELPVYLLHYTIPDPKYDKRSSAMTEMMKQYCQRRLIANLTRIIKYRKI